MKRLCWAKDTFGKPNEGLRKQYRVFNISMVDLIPSIIAGLILAKVTNIKYIYGVLIVLILGIIFHRIFCVETTIDKLLFKN
jgi:hypothetical protein